MFEWYDIYDMISHMEYAVSAENTCFAKSPSTNMTTPLVPVPRISQTCKKTLNKNNNSGFN